MSQTFEGGCACGTVRYRMTSAPMFVHCCHCTSCQRQSGAAFAVNALIETGRVETLSGEPQAVTLPTDSGRPHVVLRCPTCQIAVWSHYGGRKEVAFVRVGTLDEPAAMAPDVHIFARSKLPWVRLPEGAAAFDVYYKTEEQWPPESLARRAAMMG